MSEDVLRRLTVEAAAGRLDPVRALVELDRRGLLSRGREVLVAFDVKRRKWDLLAVRTWEDFHRDNYSAARAVLEHDRAEERSRYERSRAPRKPSGFPILDRITDGTEYAVFRGLMEKALANVRRKPPRTL